MRDINQKFERYGTYSWIVFMVSNIDVIFDEAVCLMWEKSENESWEIGEIKKKLVVSQPSLIQTYHETTQYYTINDHFQSYMDVEPIFVGSFMSPIAEDLQNTCHWNISRPITAFSTVIWIQNKTKIHEGNVTHQPECPSLTI